MVSTDADALLAEMAADADLMSIPDDRSLKTVSELANTLVAKKAEVVAAEKALATLKADVADIEERQLPELMTSVGLAEFKLPDGSYISVGQEYYPNLPGVNSEDPAQLERRESIFRWMRSNQHGDLIKREIALTFGRGEDDKATRVTNGLAKAGIPYRDLEQVHPQTLKAFVREQCTKPVVEGTPPFPRELFGVHVKTVASVKPPKKSKHS
jgi:hypothetical protein